MATKGGRVGRWRCRGGWIIVLFLGLPMGERQATMAVAEGRSLADGGSASELVARGRIDLTLEGARLVIRGAESKAFALGIKENIAVVDQGGHLVAFERMDGARPASGYTALTKATTAATFRQATGPIGGGEKGPDPLLNLSLQNAALASGGKLTTLKGGVPIEIDGQVTGGVGVGGGSGEQDLLVAKAGVQALLEGLKMTPGTPRIPGGRSE